MNPDRHANRDVGLRCAALLALIAGACSPAPAAVSDAANGEVAGGDQPVFRVDATWPKPFEQNWILGQLTAVAVDSRDHVWITHATGGLSFAALGATHDPPTAICCTPAPEIIAFDAEGNVVQAWDFEPGQPITNTSLPGVHLWPASRHGIFVDHNDFVWLGTRGHHQVLKFTRDGELVLAIGTYDTPGGSNERGLLGTPADMWVSPETNEVFIADGYGNRRVVVHDGETGEYLRHWGAYGNVPDDEYEFVPPEQNPPLPPQFNTVHGIQGSRDGLLYVGDRTNNRIQVFRQSGEFVKEGVVAPGTLWSGSAYDIALSADPEQRFLYLVDGANQKIWILEREDLLLIGEIGQGGYQAGNFIRPHNLASDSRGNLYTAEVETQRVQRFLVGTPGGE